jgi:hypothetical protein
LTKKSAEIRLFGIRHHGPGSAGRLVDALNEWKPDCLLIEGPADVSPLLTDVDFKTFTPPVALLSYVPSDLSQAVFYPLAEFSPEWQALIWSRLHTCPVHFIDLPAGTIIESTNQDSLVDFEILQRDPLGTLARVQGYNDVEGWWDAHFETHTVADVFIEIMHLIQEMRKEYATNDSNLIREAFMRQEIRKYLKQNYEKIAVICGAWHLPALDIKDDSFRSKDDKILLQACSFQKTKSLWIPWSYQRLAKSSGYLAGVTSPMWYDILFRFKSKATYHWMAYTGYTLREKGYDIPPSLSIDATRTAEALASVRQLNQPGFTELIDASVAVFGYTDSTILHQIYGNLQVGNKMGQIPDNSEKLPIQEDFEKEVKRLRLSKDIQNTYPTDKNLDLRKDLHQQISSLLNRLQLLSVPWGEKLGIRGTGTFKEIWTLQWDPSYYFNLLEAGSYGLTVKEAATQKARMDSANKPLVELLDLLSLCLDADLPDALPEIIAATGRSVLHCQDVLLLIKSFNKTGRLLEKGHSRLYNKTILENIQLDLAICINARMQLDMSVISAEAAGESFREFAVANGFMGRLDTAIQYGWKLNLLYLARQTHQVNALHGAAFRICSVLDEFSEAEQSSQIQAIFSLAEDIEAAANWLEGYLQDSFLILLYDDLLRSKLMNWVDHMLPETFDMVLPVLRRAFGSASPVLKSKLFRKLGGKSDVETKQLDPLPVSLESRLDDWIG